MKKFIYTFFIISALFVSSCKSDNVSKIGTGVKVISNCCSKLSAVTSKANSSSGDEGTEIQTAEDNKSSSFLPPSFLWDAKMMVR